MNFRIKTERLVLTPIADSDTADVFRALFGHPEITKFLTFDPPETVADTEEFVKFCQESFETKTVVWCVRTPHGKFVGLTGLDDIKRDVLAWKLDIAELGYWLAPEWHGQGMATEVATAVVLFGMRQLQLHKILAGHVLENVASARVLEKVGFKEVGIRRDHFKRHGQWWDYRLLEVLKKYFDHEQKK